MARTSSVVRNKRGRVRVPSGPKALALRCMLAVSGIAGLGCTGGEGTIMLQGSGATFPAPVYKRWFLEYYRENERTRVNYSPIGSGAGIRQFTSGLVNFGASDAGISAKEIAKLPESYGGVIALPMTAGCIVLSYNVPGVNETLKLSRAVYVKIFLREITRWNDELIARDNPDVELPDQPITVVTRADSSGTTYAFTAHMSAVSKALRVDWAPGVDKSVNWKESIAAQGNDGVAALIQLTNGAIGYIEYGYAHLSGLPMAALENRAGKFVLADEKGESGLEALRGATIPDDLQIKIPDPPAPGAYPVVTYTWLLARQRYEQPNVVAALQALLRFSLGERQQEIAAELGYLRIPDEVVRGALAKIDGIEGGSLGAVSQGRP